MSRRVFLHVGAPKTGTTYLQDMLQTNLRSLAAHDVHVPGKGLTGPAMFHFRAALDLLGEDWGGRPGHAEGSWDALVRRVRRRSGTVIVSHEILAPAPRDVARRAKEDLSRGSDVELHVVYTARDPSRLLPAAWQESIKQGRRWTYRRFLQQTRNRKSWFGKAFDLPSVLETWGAGLPPERVHVVTVPRRTSMQQARTSLLWERFCEACGVDPDWARAESVADNRSLGIAETQLLRGLNRQLDRPVRRDPRYDKLIRQLLAEEELVGRRSTTLQLPPDMFPWAAEEADRWATWIKGAGVDVVGDLGDLVPPPPPPPEEYVDPDRVRPRAVLGAAMDALTAMTREAARRSDPDEHLVGRVRRRTLGS